MAVQQTDEAASPLCIGHGNKKLGLAWTFSLPSRITCPGASPWCLKHCYACRLERVRTNCRRAYLENLILTMNGSMFVRNMLASLPENTGAFRIHVGGDFHSQIYVENWIEICQERPDINFWAYTRSWRASSLRIPLERLRGLENVQLLASTDATMPLPPKDWRVAFVADDQRAEGTLCPQQQNQAESCMACGYCFRKQHGNVIFRVH